MQLISFYYETDNVTLHVEHNEQQKQVTINWSCYGEVSVEEALEFTSRINALIGIGNSILKLASEDKFKEYLDSNVFCTQTENFKVIDNLDGRTVTATNLKTNKTKQINIGELFYKYIPVFIATN